MPVPAQPAGHTPLIDVYRALSDRLATLRFAAPVTHVYNPIVYATASHDAYLERFGSKRGRVLLLGMNPGPWGMAQTGVPFGEVGLVGDWLGLRGPVGKPLNEHPKRPVTGFECPRSEVSGRRFWGLWRELFGTPGAFFEHFFVANYCPLIFLEQSGRNRIPERLHASERTALFEACDAALRQVVSQLAPRTIVGIGNFAQRCARRVAPDLPVGRVLHPSPASPAANRGWAAQAHRQLCELEIDLPALAPEAGGE